MAQIKKVEKRYDTVSQLIAHEFSEYIGICTDNKMYYIHPHNTIFDYVNPMSTYTDARYINNVLCIMVGAKK